MFVYSCNVNLKVVFRDIKLTAFGDHPVLVF